jgi:hypothetical protein
VGSFRGTVTVEEESEIFEELHSQECEEVAQDTSCVDNHITSLCAISLVPLCHEMGTQPDSLSRSSTRKRLDSKSESLTLGDSFVGVVLCGCCVVFCGR